MRGYIYVCVCVDVLGYVCVGIMCVCVCGDILYVGLFAFVAKRQGVSAVGSERCKVLKLIACFS